MRDDETTLPNAVMSTLSSGDSNIVDVLRDGLRSVSLSICADDGPMRDAGGQQVNSLTEAMMGIAGALLQVAAAIREHTATIDRET